jgi:hypothetical protein
MRDDIAAVLAVLIKVLRGPRGKDTPRAGELAQNALPPQPAKDCPDIFSQKFRGGEVAAGRHLRSMLNIV